MWKLKPNQPQFEMVDGPMAGRSYRHGKEYTEIPESEGHRFEHSGEAIIAEMAKNDNTLAAEAEPTATARAGRKVKPAAGEEE